MDDLITNLRQNNLKVTPQRLAIYGYLMSTVEHPSAETIYNYLHPAYPNMSLATVYKTLASLRDAGLVMELNAGEDSFRYDANTSRHAHIVCRKCHSVADYFGEVIARDTVSCVEKNTGYEIESEQTYFFGLCGECRKGGEG